MNIDFNILMALIAFSAFVAVLGFWMQRKDEQTIIPALSLFVSASLFFFLFATVDNIIVGYNQVTDTSQITESTIANITTYGYLNDNIQGTDLSIGNFAGSFFARGELLSSVGGSILEGDKIQCIEIPLYKTGSPTGIATIGIFGVNAQTPFATFGTQDVSLLTGSAIYYTYCVPEGSEIHVNAGQVIGIVYKAGNSTNHIMTPRDSAGSFDGTNTQRGSIQFGSTTWGGVSGEDTTMRAYDLVPIFAISEDFVQTVEPNLVDMSELKYYFLVIATFLMLTAVYSVKLYKGQGSGEYIDSL